MLSLIKVQQEFEVGIGTVTDASPDTLSRGIISSSNGDAQLILLVVQKMFSVLYLRVKQYF